MQSSAELEAVGGKLGRVGGGVGSRMGWVGREGAAKRRAKLGCK